METNHAFINIGASSIRTGSVSLHASTLSIISAFHIFTAIINYKFTFSRILWRLPNFTWIFVVANHKSDKRSWFIILFFTNQSKSFWVLKLCRLLNRNFLLAQGKKENLPWAQFHHSWHKIIFLSTQELDIEIFVVSQWILYKGYITTNFEPTNGNIESQRGNSSPR